MTDDVLLRFVHISDTHYNPDTTYVKDYAPHTPLIGMQALIEQVNALPFVPDFILHTGDVAYDPVPDIYPGLRDMMAKLKAPVHYVAGNHDDRAALQTVLMGRTDADLQAYPHYEAEINGVQLVVVDSNGPAELPAGRVPDEQIDWLRDLCTADDPRPLIVAVHHNVVEVNTPWLDNWMRMVNGQQFHEAVKAASHRLRGVFHGHIHQHLTGYYDGVMYVAGPSSWCQFMSYPIPENDSVTGDLTAQPGFNIVSITRERTNIRRHTFSVD